MAGKEKFQGFRRGSLLFTAAVVAIVSLVFLTNVAAATQASASAPPASTLCGDGFAPDYGFVYPLRQTHWTVDWERFVSPSAIDQVDVILDRLNADSVAQTMILFKPKAEVGNRVNCAVHFLRYMKLGLPSGDRKDNGFVFLIVVDSTQIDVHYGVGLGLPALTAPELTTLNRAAEDSFQTNRNMDQALLTLVQGFDTYTRSKYPPLVASVSPTLNANTPAAQPLGFWSIVGLICIGIPVLIFLLWLFIKLAQMGIIITPSSGSSGWGGSSSGGGWDGGDSPSRGGGGSGRSGRGN